MSSASYARTAHSLGEIALVAILALAAAACGRQPGPTLPAPEYPADTVTAEEIARVDARTALDAVRLLRPEFLAWARGSAYDAARPRVYIDHVPASGPHVLMTVPAAAVALIRLLPPYEATLEYGTENSAGALEVLTRTPRVSR